MTPLLGVWLAKAKEAPSPHEVRVALLNTNPEFQCLLDSHHWLDTNPIFQYHLPTGPPLNLQTVQALILKQHPPPPLYIGSS